MGILYKKNNLQFLTIACFIFLIVNGTAASYPAPTTLYVGGEGSGNYTTIQAAINNASFGDTILVYPGTYTENVNASVENISIRSYSGNPDDTIIKREEFKSNNIKITANNVTISGFTITGAGSTGIYMSRISGANIINNKLSGVGCGIQMERSSRCNLINNTVSDSAQHGFYLSSSSNHCILANNTISDTGEEGILLRSSVYCTLTNNVISNTYYEGIYLNSSSNCNVTGNTVSNTEDDGIDLNSSSNCNITGNTVSSTEDDGIDLNSSSNCNVTGNTVSNTGDDGIDLDSSSNCNINGNAVLNTEDDGICLVNSENCILTNNTVSNASDEGVCLSYSSGCTLTDNTISNADYGITVNSDDCVLRNNTATSGIYGISLWHIENCTLTGNIMSENLYNFDLDIYDLDNGTGNIIDISNLVDGKAIYYLEGEPNPSIGSDAGVVYCINCGDVEIKNLVLQNNTYGVFLYNTSSEIQNNTINNTIYGMMVLSSQDVRISDSMIENSMIGVDLEKAINTTLADNTVQNSLFGIEAVSSENCTLSNNSIRDSIFVGIATISSENCMFLNNSVRNSIYGIITLGSENCTLMGNSVQDSMENYGLLTSGNSKLVSGKENTLIRENTLIKESTLVKENTLVNSNLVQSQALNDFGIYSEDCQNLRLENNTIDQIDFIGISLEGCQDVRFVRNSVRNIGYTGIYSDNSANVELLDNTVQNVTGEAQLVSGNSPLVSSPLVSKSLGPSGYGICFAYSNEFRLEGNNVEDCCSAWGIYLYEPVNSTLKFNTLKNCQAGLIAIASENCSVSDCSVTNCTSGGIVIMSSEEVAGPVYAVTDCTVEGSAIGLLVTGEGTLARNNLSGNSYGMVLYDVNNSLIYGNKMVRNSLAGIAIDPEESELTARSGLVRSIESPESSNNTIYNNYFNNVNNTLIYSEANNTWNISKTSGESIVGGPYLGGNYWANPNGTGFSENCTDADRDGIADSSYEIVNGTFDYLPLTTISPAPIPTHRHKSSTNYIPSSGESTGVTGIDSAQKKVVAGSKTSFSFTDPVSGILGLSFTSQQYSGNVIARIEVLGDGSSGEKPEGEVYQLMNILVGNERFESGSNINGAAINFRVSKSWVEENNIDVSTITINRFQDEKWNALVTEMTYEDKEYYYFKAETPGFSRYAITGDKLGTEIITPAKEKETGTVTGEEQTNDEKTPGFESTFAILGVLASVFFAKKRILK
ncbi:hypothetical protein EO95_06595 [Methanosarcina sp. 1.H.T.1A.1]|uniref:NosD domain-containing protein n=1 Tax=Methanosarcina sp. 1.H.T.1A.1 TaxID=1483602 RepID=UPI000622277C|nr:NosD domain-containing protein [Methanosarcina sp. 1.H.T.1A.1]KKH97020.1 hypothetical protein EO95_06595 [Methanosarcina sp. 1.H.T.1A.1]